MRPIPARDRLELRLRMGVSTKQPVSQSLFLEASIACGERSHTKTTTLEDVQLTAGRKPKEPSLAIVVDSHCAAVLWGLSLLRVWENPDVRLKGDLSFLNFWETQIVCIWQLRRNKGCHLDGRHPRIVRGNFRELHWPCPCRNSLNSIHTGDTRDINNRKARRGSLSGLILFREVIFSDRWQCDLHSF